MPHLKNVDYWSYQDRMLIISAYDGWIRSQMEIKRLEFYYVNFMFNRLPGGRPARIEQMKSEVTRFHSILSRHVVRKRNAWMWKFLIPQLFGVPDLPVWKHKKTTIAPCTLNDGLHFNAIIRMPPRFTKAELRNRESLVFRSRLKVPLDQHVDQCLQFYLTDKLHRIDVTRITSGTMVDYTFKTLKNGHVGYDDILVL